MLACFGLWWRRRPSKNRSAAGVNGSAGLDCVTSDAAGMWRENASEHWHAGHDAIAVLRGRERARQVRWKYDVW